ncbi:unnamed protein product [Rhizoctonia solani]|uniref:Uncharacterized protein n=1 Tax=Rhizoctonia solani TaxID=456999 RepID=A0A8H3CYM1_9AGAM|nr:unnamed protein product [Rhizoctonia solani]
MDELYMSILKGEFGDPNRNPEELKLTKLVLWSAVCIQEPLTMISFARLLQLDDDQRLILASGTLESVLYTSEGTELIANPPASFLEFLLSRRSGEYACDESTHHGLLAQRCFELMQDKLQFNICNSDSSLSRDRDVRDPDAKVNTVISEELFYSCQYVGAHVQMSAPNPSLIAHLHEFILHQLLAWLEVLSLKQAVSSGVPTLAAINAWLRENDISSDIIPLVHDARKFVASFAVIPACSSTPHIHVSHLSTWRRDSPMFQIYGDLIRDIVAVDGDTINYLNLYTYHNPEFLSAYNTESSRRLTTIPSGGTTQPTPKGSMSQQAISSTKIPPQIRSVRSVMVSADNTSIMSASGHLTAVWDRKTGKGLSGGFHIRPACFGIVAFSHDRRRVATASSHCDVFVWDASTEKLAVGPFHGHRSWVTAIAFSPDGTRIVSGARDQVVLVWDICSPSAPVRILEGHSGYVLSVVFSPDSSRVVSASTDNTVRVWDVQKESSASLLLTGHTDCVRSVDVSPDGTRVVSGADDRSIRIWDMFTGQTIYGHFEGHSDYVLCVKFSPNGQQVVSGSQDCTVRVWDVNTGEVVGGPFIGHTSRVNTVTFSMDGTQVISGSDDGTIRIWDLQAQTDINAHIENAPADPHPVDESDAPGTWKLKPDGWVVDQDERLLIWIPPLSHYAIRPPPPDHILIPRFDLPISSLLEGKAWKELCRRQEGKSIRYEI